MVEEPTPVEAAAMLQGMIPRLEEHHKVKYAPQAIREAVRLATRWVIG